MLIKIVAANEIVFRCNCKSYRGFTDRSNCIIHGARQPDYKTELYVKAA